jgi:Mg-chelatase subunit ChlD
MSYIVVSRNPRTNKLVIVTDGDDNVPAEFGTEDEAAEAASNTTICKAWGYDVIECP